MKNDMIRGLAMLCIAGMACGVSAQPFVEVEGEENAQPDPFFRAPPPEANFAQAMPMPDDSNIPAVESDLNSMRPVVYDVRTGIQTIGAPVNVTVPMASGEVPALPGLMGDGDEGFSSRNFGSLTLVNNPETFPWNINCKLLMRFGSSYTVCSGTLIDRRTVLTAGHCIHQGSGGNFADEVWVFPGYENADGNNGGLPFTDESDWPFGFGKSVALVTWSGWANSGDFNVDQGYIRLDRPIGFITGNYGYGYNSSCSYFTGNNFNNNSYPAEAAFGWTGNFMYTRFGSFDSCPSSNRAQYNSAGYGGMSGSSEYFLSGGSRTAYGVASTSDRATYT
ncbi:MAG TPA: trypsin-like serine protease, partial [Phycisphaerales bacterium]|nr:trypsin-like serine protease [Phycisphaerales bacterium]